MSYLAEPLLVGTSADPITVRLTPGAAALLEGLPGSQTRAATSDHRSLLTTIVVAQAASGQLLGSEVVVDSKDILQVLDHAATTRPER